MAIAALPLSVSNLANNPVSGITAGIPSAVDQLTQTLSPSVGPAVSGGNPVFTDRNVYNIAPTATNLGEIIKNLTGPPNNGGFGAENFMRSSAQTSNLRLQGGREANNLLIIAGAAILGVVGFALIRRGS